MDADSGPTEAEARAQLPTSLRMLVEGRDLYGSEGPAGLSMRRLANRVGVALPELYRHYPSRDRLVSAIAAHAWFSFNYDLRRHEDLEPARARLNAMTHDALDFALANPHLWQLMFARRVEESAGSEIVLRRVAETLWSARREEAIRDDTLPPTRYARGWLALVFGCATLHRVGFYDDGELRTTCMWSAGRVLGLA
jgi:AcrR family transcriptional regulator